jgi:hypothetical protein
MTPHEMTFFFFGVGAGLSLANLIYLIARGR